MITSALQSRVPRRRDAVKLVLGALVLLVALVAAGCGEEATVTTAGNVTAGVSLEQARDMALNALEAFNSGDYEAWTRDWSQTMRDAIPESAFQAFREASLELYGRYVRLGDLRMAPAEAEGFVRIEAPVTFEKREALFWFALPRDGRQIEGVYLDPL